MENQLSVIKRDGTMEVFTWGKIHLAILKAMEEVYGTDDALKNTNEVVDSIEFAEVDDGNIDVEHIQDTIEDALIEGQFNEVAKRYIRYRHDRAKRREQGWQMDDLQQSIWEHKYRQDGESFDQWLDRVSGGNARVRRLMETKKFLFAGRILSNRGMDKRGKKVTLSNCYVLPEPEDNLESIYQVDYEMARTFSYGGGVGTGISKLRPKGARVNNSAKTTSGAVSFMDQFDATTGRIGQNGRRGALMLTMDCDHPDIQEFLDIKTKDNSINHANISMKVSDDFMFNHINDLPHKLVWKGKDQTITKEIMARELMRQNARNNWDWAEAGMLYWDTISKDHLMSDHPEHEFAGVNPCGEEPLMAYGSCLLGALNLSEFVVHPFTDMAYFDFHKFGEAVHTAIEGLNEVLDESIHMHPLKGQRDNAYLWRQIGLGVMGYADMLVKLKKPYGKGAVKFTEKLSRFMLNEALRKSAYLSKEKAMEDDQITFDIDTPMYSGAFPKFDMGYLSKSHFFQSRVDDDVKDLICRWGLRNSQITTIAPTGSTSTMLGVSGGMEPIFATSYSRKTESLHGEDRHYKVYTPIVKQAMDHEGVDKVPSYINTSHDVKWEDRIHIQSAWQRYIDASISSTVNLPNSATVEDVERLFEKAWYLRLKGVTIFRDGCKRAGILTTSEPEQEEDQEEEVVEEGKIECTECGEEIEVITNGCTICMNCGHSPCS